MNAYIPITNEAANWISKEQDITVTPNEICTFIFFHELGHRRHREKIKELKELEKMGKTDTDNYKTVYKCEKALKLTST